MFAILLSLIVNVSFADPVQDLVNQAQSLNLAKSTQWLRLMHYNTTILGYESEVDGPEYFLDRRGMFSGSAELEATIKSFYLPKDNFKVDEHPLCRFPARLRFLQRYLKFQDLPKPECHLYDLYLKRLNPESVSFVFSSYFMNSPGSAFGHTFIRVNRKIGQNEIRNELLDTGIGYAAEVTTDNPILYPIFGLIGFFRGIYSSVPYYYKVREYNDFEARDLWSYDLNLTREEVDILVDHLWELGGTWYRYFFLTENCAYHLLTAIDAAAPRLNLTKHVPYWVIPSDSVKAITREPGLVGKISYRPSSRSLFKHRYSELNEDQKILFKDLIKSQQPADITSKPAMSKVEKAEILDTFLDYWDYKNAEILIDEKSAPSLIKHKFLGARASLAIPSEDLNMPIPRETQPDLGHRSGRATLFNGYSPQRQFFTQLNLRFALHDPLDDPIGYPPNSQLEFANFKFRYWHKTAQLYIEEIEGFRILSLAPWNDLERPISWRINVGLMRNYDENCDYCLIGGVSPGGGFSFKPHETLLTYAFADSEFYYSDSLNRPTSLKLGVGPTAGLFIMPSSLIRFKVELGYRYYVLKEYTDSRFLNLEAKINLDKEFGVGASASFYPTLTQSSLNLHYTY